MFITAQEPFPLPRSVGRSTKPARVHAPVARQAISTCRIFGGTLQVPRSGAAEGAGN